MKQIFAVFCITLLLGVYPAFAAPPATITYQGYLTNNSGSAISGNVAMILSLYDADGNATNTPLWSESHPTVPVANGIYTVQLGSIAALNLPFDTTYYLGVAVGGESEMVPRLTLTSAPTVFRAMSADKLNQTCADGQLLLYSSGTSSWSCTTPGALAAKSTIANADVAVSAAIATSKLSGAVTAITGHGLSAVATSGAYSDLTGTPVAGTNYLAPNGDGSGLTGLSKTQVGLGNVDNTSDANKPVSSATSTALALKANLASPTFTGTVTSPAFVGALTGNATTATSAVSVTGMVAVANGGTGATTAPLARTALGLGSAATYNVGTGTYNVVYLNGSAQLPAVDGSLLTGVKLLSFGGRNTAGGTFSLPTSTTGYDNTAFGFTTLFNNTKGIENSAFGYGALSSNTEGNANVAYGTGSMSHNISGSYNTAHGVGSLVENTIGNFNSAFGHWAMNSNISGNENTASGYLALYNNSTGTNNMSSGNMSMYWNTTGSFNTALGNNAGVHLTTGDYNIDIGNMGVAGEGNTIRIGDNNQTKTFISGIRGVSSLTGIQSVVIDANGQLGSVASSSGTVTAVTGTAPVVSSGGTAPVISIAAADTSTAGYLTAADWNAFNNKAPLASPTFTGTVTAPVFAGALTGNVTGNVSGVAANVTGTVAVANGGTGATDAASARTNLGLGSAATLNAGTTAGNLVQLDGSAKLPAVDGSLLTNVTLSSFGNMNTKAGDDALINNTSGGTNVAIGYGTLGYNTTGSDNNALGYEALLANTTADKNTAIGNWALHLQSYNNSGDPYPTWNVAIGGNSLRNNNPVSIATGIRNTAVGYDSLSNNSIGANNIGVGFGAGSALTTGNNNIDIGNAGLASESNTIRLGKQDTQVKTFIAGIEGATGVSNPKSVVIDPATGQLGSVAITASPSAATTVTTQAYSDAGTVGAAMTFAREDHKHVFPASTKDTTAATGILKGNGTAVTAAVAGDFPILNQNTTGTAANVTGTVAVANGGTGATTLTGYVKGSGTSAMSSSATIPATDLSGTVAVANGGTGATTLTGYVKGMGTSAMSASATIPATDLSGTLPDARFPTTLPAVDGSQLTKVKLGSDSKNNTAGGSAALAANTGDNNTAFGTSALAANVGGTDNTAVGSNALAANMVAWGNTAIGANALIAINAINASENTAVGMDALRYNINGLGNTALGYSALSGNHGSGNIGIGMLAGMYPTNGNYNIYIGNHGGIDDDSVIRIGGSPNNQNKAFIAGIYGKTTAGAAVPAMIDANGQLGTVSSSIRYKEDVNNMGDLTSRLFDLRPVTFRYKTQSAAVHYGLIAEEVDQVMPELVVRGNDGLIETVAYHELTPMLLNELQKEHKLVQDLTAENVELKARLLKIEKALGL